MIQTISFSEKLRQRVFAAVGKIPRGRVASYKQIALLAGFSNPRLVGTIIHRNTDPVHIPCHRVVRADGTLASAYAFGGARAQQRRLEEEGIIFVNGRIAEEKFQISNHKSQINSESQIPKRGNGE